MKVQVEMSNETLQAIMDGKCVEGSLRLQLSSMGTHSEVAFRSYNRKPRVREKDRLVKKLPWGWVKESIERIKVFGSFPKDFCTAQIIELLNEHNQDAKNALVEKELDLIEFC